MCVDTALPLLSLLCAVTAADDSFVSEAPVISLYVPVGVVSGGAEVHSCGYRVYLPPHAKSSPRFIAGRQLEIRCSFKSPKCSLDGQKGGYNDLREETVVRAEFQE